MRVRLRPYRKDGPTYELSDLRRSWRRMDAGATGLWPFFYWLRRQWLTVRLVVRRWAVEKAQPPQVDVIDPPRYLSSWVEPGSLMTYWNGKTGMVSGRQYVVGEDGHTLIEISPKRRAT